MPIWTVTLILAATQPPGPRPPDDADEIIQAPDDTDEWCPKIRDDLDLDLDDPDVSRDLPSCDIVCSSQDGSESCCCLAPEKCVSGHSTCGCW